MNLSISELGLDIKNPFTSVYIPPNEQSSRSSLSIRDLRRLQGLCLKANDEQRLVIALLSDTGLRLSEALGLVSSDVDLTSPTPSLTVRSHPWRSLKTSSSNRVVPLVGVSLLAAQRVIEQASSQFLFPSFASNTNTKSNMASAKLNQWLKKKLSNEYVIHSLRHTFRDRLRATKCPSEMINELGGWTKSTVGESYGDGYPLKLKYEQMIKITDVENYV
jgi:integrase